MLSQSCARDSSRLQCTAKVFLLAENRLLREALIRLLTKRSDTRVVGASPYSLSVHEEIIATRPNIIVLDSTGQGISKARLIPTLHAVIPDLRFVMVDMDPDENTFLRAVREGVVGYVLKDASAIEMAATIRAVAAGEAVCPPPLSMVLFRSVAQQVATPPMLSWGRGLGLSRREQQLVELLRERLTNKEIAARLNLSEQTVKNHVHRILRKSGAPNRFTLVERCNLERLHLARPSHGAPADNEKREPRHIESMRDYTPSKVARNPFESISTRSALS
jgi:two-component system response regulator DevR